MLKHTQGIYWEKGALQGCCITFTDENSSFCIGSEPADGPGLLVESNSYIYLCVSSAKNGSDDYYVIEDFDGPIRLRQSGFVYDFGDQRIRLL